MKQDTKEIDLFVESEPYRILHLDYYAKNPEWVYEAEGIFEETQSLQAVNNYCRKMLQKPVVNKLFAEAKIDKRFQLATLENFELIDEITKKAKQQADEYIKNIEKHQKRGTNLILSGFKKVGTGKTHLACAIAQELTKKDIPVKFINVTSMLEQIKETFNTFELTSTEILIIDDLGKEKKTEWVCEQLYTIINNRYQKMKPTIITTEGSINDLKEGYSEKGNALVSRLIENFILIKLDGEDYRKKKAKTIYNGKYD